MSANILSEIYERQREIRLDCILKEGQLISPRPLPSTRTKIWFSLGMPILSPVFVSSFTTSLSKGSSQDKGLAILTAKRESSSLPKMSTSFGSICICLKPFLQRRQAAAFTRSSLPFISISEGGRLLIISSMRSDIVASNLFGISFLSGFANAPSALHFRLCAHTRIVCDGKSASLDGVGKLGEEILENQYGFFSICFVPGKFCVGIQAPALCHFFQGFVFYLHSRAHKVAVSSMQCIILPLCSRARIKYMWTMPLDCAYVDLNSSFIGNYFLQLLKHILCIVFNVSWIYHVEFHPNFIEILSNQLLFDNPV